MMKSRTNNSIISTIAALAIILSIQNASFGAESKKKTFTPPPFPFHKIPDDGPAFKLTGVAAEAWTKGEAAFRANDFDGAIARFQEVVKLQPEYSRGHERLGSAMAATGNYSGATTELQKAITLDDKDFLPHLVLGRIILAQGKENEGVVEAQKAYDMNPWYCTGFLGYSNNERFDPHKWFVLANYWKEMKADSAKVQPAVTKDNTAADKPCCEACAKDGMGNAEACDKKGMMMGGEADKKSSNDSSDAKAPVAAP